VIRLCVFDCDGTLVDSQHGISVAMATAFDGEGLEPPTADAVRRVVGLPLVEAVAVLAPDAGSETWISVGHRYADAFAALRTGGALEEPLYPGVIDALDRLEAAGWLLAVATGKSRGAPWRRSPGMAWTGGS